MCMGWWGLTRCLPTRKFISNGTGFPCSSTPGTSQLRHFQCSPLQLSWCTVCTYTLRVIRCSIHFTVRHRQIGERLLVSRKELWQLLSPWISFSSRYESAENWAIAIASICFSLFSQAYAAVVSHVSADLSGFNEEPASTESSRLHWNVWARSKTSRTWSKWTGSRTFCTK